MSFVNHFLKIRLTGASYGLIMALVEIKGLSFNYLDNWTTLNCIQDTKHHCHF